MNIFQRLAAGKIIMADVNRQRFLCWNGGEIIFVYSIHGKEKDRLRTKDDQISARETILNYISTGAEPSTINHPTTED